MTASYIPAGSHTVTPYLFVEGASDYIAFLGRAFGAIEKVRMPAPDGTIMHAEVRLGDSNIMITEARGPWKAQGITLHLYLPDCDAVYNQAMAAGCESVMTPMDQFYGDRMGGVKDKFGNHWWLATHKEDLTPEQMKARHEEFSEKLKAARSQNPLEPEMNGFADSLSANAPAANKQWLLYRGTQAFWFLFFMLWMLTEIAAVLDWIPKFDADPPPSFSLLRLVVPVLGAVVCIGGLTKSYFANIAFGLLVLALLLRSVYYIFFSGEYVLRASGPGVYLSLILLALPILYPFLFLIQFGRPKAWLNLVESTKKRTGS